MTTSESPWWKSGIFAAVLGFAIPAATAVQGWFQKEREMALQLRHQAQELRLAYMRILVEVGVEGMGLVADFAAQTEEDEDLRLWAQRIKEQALTTAQTERKALEEESERFARAEQARDEALGLADGYEKTYEKLLERAGSDRLAEAEVEKATRDAQKAAENARAARRRATEARTDMEMAAEKFSHSKGVLSGRPAVVENTTRAQTLDTALRAAPELRTVSPTVFQNLGTLRTREAPIVPTLTETR